MLNITSIVYCFVLFSAFFGDWILIDDTKAGFSISFPVDPVIKEDSLDAGIGMTYTKTLSTSVGDGMNAKIYLANFTAYPPEMNLNDKDSTGYFLCQTIIEQVSQQLEHAVILYNEATIINSRPSQLASIRYGADSSILRIAMIMHNNKLVSMQYYSPFETGMSKDAEKFFYSCRMF